MSNWAKPSLREVSVSLGFLVAKPALKPLLKIVNECRSLTGLGRIKPLLKILDGCRSLTGLGELNPY